MLIDWVDMAAPFAKKVFATQSTVSKALRYAANKGANSVLLPAERIGVPVKFIHIAQILNGASA